MADPEDYDSGMAHQGLGHAFFRPESSMRVKIGMCGYIDGSGTWHTIVDCSNNTANENSGYSSIDMDQLFEVKPSKQLWGPQCTETVTRSVFKVDTGTTFPTGIPAHAASSLEFTLNAEFGAVLLCKGYVTKQSYDLLDPFRDWARANAEQILKNVSDVRRHGFYVIGSTFSAPEAIVNAWRGRSQKKTLGFSCGVDEIGQLGTHIDIYGANDADGWVRYPPQGVNSAIYQVSRRNRIMVANISYCLPTDEDEHVVFFGGLKYDYHILTGWMRKVEIITSSQHAANLSEISLHSHTNSDNRTGTK